MLVRLDVHHQAQLDDLSEEHIDLRLVRLLLDELLGIDLANLWEVPHGARFVAVLRNEDIAPFINLVFYFELVAHTLVVFDLRLQSLDLLLLSSVVDGLHFHLHLFDNVLLSLYHLVLLSL